MWILAGQGRFRQRFPAGQDLRLYVNGSVTDKIKFMFNTEYDGNNHVNVLDAVAQFELSARQHLGGPHAAAERPREPVRPVLPAPMGVYTDGVQDGYPFVATGRDNGVALLGPVRQGEGFRPARSTARRPPATRTLIAPARVAGRFLGSGGRLLPERHLLRRQEHPRRRARAARCRTATTAYSGDFLLEKKLPGGGAFTDRERVAKYDKLGGYNARYGTRRGRLRAGQLSLPADDGHDRQVRDPRQVRQGELQPGHHRRSNVDYNQKTTEVNFNYIIKEFNARVMLFYMDTRFNAVQTNNKQVGVGLQVQM